MEVCLSIKFAYLGWLTCKKCLLGGHGKARRTVKALVPFLLEFCTLGLYCILLILYLGINDPQSSWQPN